MRRVCSGLLLGAMLTVSVWAKDDGFTGKWILDKEASTATADIPDNLRQEIKKKGDGYQVETSWREMKTGMAPLALLGIMTTLLKLGPDVTNQVGPFMQKSQTTIDGNRMVTNWTAVVNGQGVKGQWTRTLGDDGKSLTMDIQESTDDGKSNTGKLVFKKK